MICGCVVHYRKIPKRTYKNNRMIKKSGLGQKYRNNCTTKGVFDNKYPRNKAALKNISKWVNQKSVQTCDFCYKSTETKQS